RGRSIGRVHGAKEVVMNAFSTCGELRRSAPLAFPPPCGEGQGGGRAIRHRHASPYDPPPHPSPARREAVHRCTPLCLITPCTRLHQRKHAESAATAVHPK